jgi:hypothetical protein
MSEERLSFVKLVLFELETGLEKKFASCDCTRRLMRFCVHGRKGSIHVIILIMFNTKLLYDNRERCDSSPGVMHHALEAQKVRQAIRTMVEESALLDYSVGLSGSTSLSWKIHEDPGKYPLPMIYFKPYDCDMFVCSKHCLDKRGKSCFL